MNLNLLQHTVTNYNNNNFSLLESDEYIRELFQILVEQKVIELRANGKIKKLNLNNVYVGTLEVRKHFGFLYTKEESYYVHDTKNYISGDIVVAIEHEGFSGDNVEVRLIGLLQRSDRKIICRVGRDLKIVPIDEKYDNYQVVFSDPEMLDLINERQIIQVQVVEVKKNTVIAKYVSLVADSNDPDIQMKIVLANFNIDTEFSEQTLEQIEPIKQPNQTEYTTRTDLRNELFMTIDGIDSKDLDDAIALSKEGDNYRLLVSIADVSHYVEENTPLDKDAYERATSVYFVDRVVPMLPKKLSNSICSLNPDVDRLTLTCEMLVNPQGEVIDSKIYESVINSKYRLTYDEVNKLLHDNILTDRLKPLYGILKEMDKLRAILNKKRLKRGAFNLEDKDAKFTIDKDSNIIDIQPSIRQNGEKLIEEFMILANETVAQTIYYLDLPFIYRVHDQPNFKKLKEVVKAFSLFGITIKGDVHEFKPQMFKQALDQLDDPISKRVLSDIIVRSLSKAKYQPKNVGHFGLASDNYTHFTSPIRRYPDLIVHRLLRKYLFEANLNYTYADEQRLVEIGIYTSEKEVNAIKASQKIEDQKKASYMKQFINTEFKGIISSIVDFGFFIELDNTVRGLIKFRNIKEFTRLDANNKIHFSTGDILTLGDTIDVKLTEVNENQGLVEFEPTKFSVNIKPKHKVNYKQKQDYNKPKSRNNKSSAKPTEFKKSKGKSTEFKKRRRNKSNKPGGKNESYRHK